ncbi:MAG: glycosyltransferase family 9 protein [Candidatus Omnitrophica bacterium]|nr:glycosyltransferase family 9 protein [Candidatus Omnitrophota bacterium]
MKSNISEISYSIRSSLRAPYLTARSFLLRPLVVLRKTGIPREGEIKEILFLRHDRIGDMVLSTGIFRGLKKRYPGARLTVLASGKNYEIIRNNPYVDETAIFDGTRDFISRFRRRNIDLVIDPFYTYELRQSFLTYISGARYRIGFEESGREMFFNMRGPKLLPASHMAGNIFRLVSFLGVNADEYEPQIYLSNDETGWAKSIFADRGLTGDFLKAAIAPGAYYPSQQWGADKYEELAGRLVKKSGVKIILFGEKSEETLLRKIQSKAGRKDAEVFCGVTLRQFMALLAQCNLLVCNNSGALHIACALKIPTVSSMGPTDPVLWWPRGKGHIVLREKLACSPCYKARCVRHDCMSRILVEDVMAAAELQIERHKNG